jgi:hypothetical protein
VTDWARRFPCADGSVTLVDLCVRSLYVGVLEGTPASMRRFVLDRLEREVSRRPKGLHIAHLAAIRAAAASPPPHDRGLPPEEVRASVRVLSGGDGRGRLDLEVVFFQEVDRDPFAELAQILRTLRMADVAEPVPVDG